MSNWPDDGPDEFGPFLAKQLQDPEVRTAYEAETKRGIDWDAVPPGFAWLAGTDTAHPFRPLNPSMGAVQCLDCLGWPDDLRHPLVEP